MMNRFCRTVDRGKTLSLISSRDHRQRVANLRHAAIGTIVRGWQIFETPLSGFELEHNLNWGFFEWSCAMLINTDSAITKQWICQQVLRFLQFCISKLRNVFPSANFKLLTFIIECTRKTWRQSNHGHKRKYKNF